MKRPIALQNYLLNDSEIGALAQRIGWLKTEEGPGPGIVFNEGDRGMERMANISYEKGIDIFPVLIDIEVKYEDASTGDQLRKLIRKKLGKYNGSMGNWEGNISFSNFLSPEYNPTTQKIVFGSIYLFKENYDYTDNTDT